MQTLDTKTLQLARMAGGLAALDAVLGTEVVAQPEMYDCPYDDLLYAIQSKRTKAKAAVAKLESDILKMGAT